MANLQTRREFLKTSGKVFAGVALSSAALPLLHISAEAAPVLEPVSYPFPYVKLDPQATLERGYKSFYDFGGCGMGAFDAIVGQLADMIGYPHDQVPIQMLASASGGYGAGTLCGSLAGAITAVGLILEPADAKKVTADLFKWYKEHPFPGYQPEIKNPTTVAGSIDCLDSCSEFMAAANVKMGDDARKARCASVTGETAAKAVELVNALKGL
jgi:hypothetical protein